jgi:hypothetical protein
MAKNKKDRKLPKRILKRPAEQIPVEHGDSGLLDRRAMEGIMRKFVAGLGGPPEDTPLSRAQDVMYRAFDTREPEKRVELARAALEISPDCADAYVLLAEESKGRKDAIQLFEKAVAAGERALGPDAFANDVGHFWGLIETRPYMRAREGLAVQLWSSGRRDEAIGDTHWWGGCWRRGCTTIWSGS